MKGLLLMDPTRFGVEFAYTLVVVILCLLVYFKTKEIYSLSKHKGVKYFRNTFLFFALAYIFRFLFLIFQLIIIEIHLPIKGKVLMSFSLLFTSYLSTLAIIFLIYSIIWKQLKLKRMVLGANLIAVIISLYTYFTHSHTALIVLQAVLLIGGLIMIFLSYNKTKKVSKMMSIYFLIFFFWVLNLFSLGPKRFFSPEIMIITNVLSLIVFVIIYLKVRKWVH